jgi:hypothetical protein
LRGFQVSYTENGSGEIWDAAIDDPEGRRLWTVLHAKPENGDDRVTQVNFEKGSPWLIVALLRLLSGATGPLVLIDDSGSEPLVVRPDVSLLELLDSYCTVEPESEEWKRMLVGVPAAGSWH